MHRTCLILAGGKGTRCRPLTNYFPKPLLPIDGVPMIMRTMKSCSKYVDQYIILVDYMEKEFAKTIGSSFCGKPVHYIKTREFSDAAPGRNSVIQQFSSVVLNFKSFMHLIPSKGQLLEFLGDIYVEESLVDRMIDAPPSHVSGAWTEKENRWEFWRLSYEIYHDVLLSKMNAEQMARLLVCCQEFETPHRLKDKYDAAQYLSYFNHKSQLCGNMFSHFMVREEEVIETNKPSDYFKEQLLFAAKHLSGDIRIPTNCTIENSHITQTVFLGSTKVTNSQLKNCIVCPDVKQIQGIVAENEILFGQPLNVIKIQENSIIQPRAA